MPGTVPVGRLFVRTGQRRGGIFMRHFARLLSVLFTVANLLAAPSAIACPESWSYELGTACYVMPTSHILTAVLLFVSAALIMGATMVAALRMGAREWLLRD